MAPSGPGGGTGARHPGQKGRKGNSRAGEAPPPSREAQGVPAAAGSEPQVRRWEPRLAESHPAGASGTWPGLSKAEQGEAKPDKATQT